MLRGKDLGALVAAIGADISQWQDATKEMARSMDDTRSKVSGTLRKIEQRLDTTGKKVSSVGARMSTYLTAPLTGFGALTLKTAGDFESSMNRVSAISGATGSALDKMRAQARQLGAETQFSASQAADAMTFLAMAGFETNQIMGAMPSVLNLAAAAQLDMASSADIASNIMAGFGMSAKELEGAVDVLAKAFTSSNTDLVQLGDAMKMVGPVASGFGIQFEEAAAAVGILSDAGLQGTMAGTGLRRILTVIATESEKLGIKAYDTAGNMLPLVDTIQQIQDAGITASEAMEIFGDRAGPAIQVLLSRGSSELQRLTSNLENAGGTAQQIADKQMEGLNGALLELRSAFEELQLAIADSGLIDFATSLVKRVTDLLRQAGSLNKEFLRSVTVFGAVVAAAGPLLFVGGKMLSLFSGVIGTVMRLTRVFGLLGRGIMLLLSPIGLKIAAVAALALIGKSLWDTFEPLQRFFKRLWDGIVKGAKWLVDSMVSAFNWLAEKVNKIFPSIRDTVVGSWNYMNFKTQGHLGVFTTNVKKNFDTAVGYVKEFVSNSMDVVSGLGGSLFDTMFSGAGPESIEQEPVTINAAQLATEKIGPGLELMKAMQDDYTASVIASADSYGHLAQRVSDMTVMSETELQRAQNAQRNLAVAAEFTSEVATRFTQSFGDGIANVVVQGQNLVDVLNNIGKLLLSSAIQKGLQMLLMGATGGTGGIIGSIFGGIFHSGGIVPGRGDRLILAQGGEGVFTPSQMEALGVAATTGVGNGNITIRNVIQMDSRTVHESLSNLRDKRNR